LAPDDPEAALAEARASLAQNDPAASVSILSPFVARPNAQPRLAALFLRAKASDAWLRRAAWFPADLCALRGLEEYVRLHAAGDPQIAIDLAEFDRAADPSHCAELSSARQGP
jgi:hypothetical protein